MKRHKSGIAAAVLLSAIASEWLCEQARAIEPVVEWAHVLVESTGRFFGANAAEIGIPLEGQVYAATASNLVRLNSGGDLLDTQEFSGIRVADVKFDRDRNYYVAGTLDLQWYLAKFSSAGALIWERMTSGDSQQLSGRIAFDPEGNVVVSGGLFKAVGLGDLTFPSSPGGPFLCKYTPAGALLWAKRVEVQGSTGPFSGRAVEMVVDSVGNVVTSGYLSGSADFGNGTVANSAGGFSTYIAKFRPNGEVAWVRAGYGWAGLAVDQKQNIYFIGGNLRCGKFAPDGTLLWERTLSPVGGSASGGAVTVTSAGEPVFVGEFEGTLRLHEHVVSNTTGTEGKSFIAKANADGHFQWALGDTGDTRSRAVRVVCADPGAIYVTGDLGGCVSRNDVWTCGTAKLGGISLAPSADGGLFVARLTDPTPVPAASPKLQITKAPTGLALSWPASASGFVLESSAALAPATWTAAEASPRTAGADLLVEIERSEQPRFFRLRRP